MMQHARSPSSHGFLGSTSFAAVYAEDKSLKSLQPHSPLNEKNGTAQVLPQDMDGPIRRGAACLAPLRDMDKYEPLVRRWMAQNPLSMIAPWVEGCESSVRKIHVQMADSNENQIDKILVESSARLFENSFRALTLDQKCTFDQFADMITGQNLRWECVGIYYTAVGLAAMTVDDYTIRTPGRIEPDTFQTRRSLARMMLQASDECKSFCEIAGQLTDPESWLYTENSHLVTLIDGDASYLFWRRIGDSISICIAKGLHGEIRPSETIPFWLSELRKRQFAVTYNQDKTAATFLGRPPRLQRRYCSMQLPLDLEPRHLRLPPSQLEAEINKLDDAGWNNEGSYRGTVYVRTTLICSMITEDIQELMLSSLPEHRADDAQGILSRSRDAWNSLPSFIKDAPRNPLNSVPQDYLPALLKLQFVHNEFLLERVLAKRWNKSNEDLIRVSRREISMVLGIFQLHNTGRHAVDMSWFIAKFGLPAAGILALDLLRQSQGQQLSSASHRSEIIQNLSGLIAALRWAASKQTANYDICNHARPVLQQVLDIVLNPRQEQQSLQIATEINSGINLEYDLLNQTQSETEFWSLLPQHPLLVDRLT